jgi:hypothetical protein
MASSLGSSQRQKETSMDEQQRSDSGMSKRRKILGNAWVDKSLQNRNAFNTEFQDLISRYAWGEIWTRPHYDERTRHACRARPVGRVPPACPRGTRRGRLQP